MKERQLFIILKRSRNKCILNSQSLSDNFEVPFLAFRTPIYRNYEDFYELITENKFNIGYISGEHQGYFKSEFKGSYLNIKTFDNKKIRLKLRNKKSYPNFLLYILSIFWVKAFLLFRVYYVLENLSFKNKPKHNSFLPQIFIEKQVKKFFNSTFQESILVSKYDNVEDIKVHILDYGSVKEIDNLYSDFNTILNNGYTPISEKTLVPA